MKSIKALLFAFLILLFLKSNAEVANGSIDVYYKPNK